MDIKFMELSGEANIAQRVGVNLIKNTYWGKEK
jgi:hypothetical protein